MRANPDDTAVLCCDTLLPQVDAAQKKLGTSFEVFTLDRSNHVEPEFMRAHILETIETIPARYTTLLVAMGFCGGSWQDVVAPRKLVIPRIDDCVTAVLNTDGLPHNDLKEPGHLYVIGSEDAGYAPQPIMDHLLKEHEPWEAELLFNRLFEGYFKLDIVDTGLYDCYGEDFVARMQDQADRIECTLDYVEGANLTVEKLLAGDWDEMFWVVEPGERITQGRFFA